MKRRTNEIRKVILEEVDSVASVSASRIAKDFGISRQAVFKNIRELVASEILVKTGSDKFPYRIKPIRAVHSTVQIGPETQENKVWSELVAPLLIEMKNNVREISHYGFTEMFNNVIDHSMSKTADIWASVDALVVRIAIQDHGIGIWKKLQEAFHLDDPRHALLELTKGKLTTDPRRHTGEGIFFTSRMFDKFHLASEKLTFCRFQKGDEWLFDVKEDDAGPGTRVSMRLHIDSEQTPKAVFDAFTTELDNFGFSKTNLSVELAKYEGDHLISRSQAKRLLARLDKFKEVYLDFKDVTEIGQAFADEIFRVFSREHSGIKLIPTNTAPAVLQMINRARSIDQDDQTELPI